MKKKDLNCGNCGMPITTQVSYNDFVDCWNCGDVNLVRKPVVESFREAIYSGDEVTVRRGLVGGVHNKDNN